MKDKSNSDKHLERYIPKENSEQKQRFQVIHDEQAVKQEPVPHKVSVFHHPKKKKKRKNTAFLLFIFTVLAASTIGILFGMGMLQMFVTIDDGSAANSTPEVSQPAVNPNSETNLYQLPILSGYVLQAGVFSERENAIEWQESFTDTNIPALLWEKDGQHFLFAGIYETEDAAKIKASEQIEQLELFVKPWSTSEKELELTTEEQEWLTKFHEVWNTTMVAKDRQSFSDLVDNAPNSEYINEMIDYIKTDQVENVEQFYLDLIYLYEQIGKDI